MVLLFIIISLFMQQDDQYLNWNEDTISVYSGDYLYFNFEDYTPEKYKVTELKIDIANTKVTANIGSFYNTTLDEDKVFKPLHNPKIEGNVLSADNLGELLGDVQSGRFVKQYPPANSKGKVTEGLLFGDLFYARVN